MSEQPPATAEETRPLVLVKGNATAEEVAALVAVVQGIAAAQAAAAGEPPAPPRREWSAHHRKVRPPVHAGPGGWRSSAMPR